MKTYDFSDLAGIKSLSEFDTNILLNGNRFIRFTLDGVPMVFIFPDETHNFRSSKTEIKELSLKAVEGLAIIQPASQFTPITVNVCWNDDGNGESLALIELTTNTVLMKIKWEGNDTEGVYIYEGMEAPEVWAFIKDLFNEQEL